MTKEQDLAMRLPYKTYFRVEYGTTNRPTGDYILDAVYISGVIGGFNYDNNVMTDKFKLILRPLSDLTKEIEHKGEGFVPIEKIKESFIEGTEDALYLSLEAIEYFIDKGDFSRIEYLPFILIQKLIEWHFDITGLIDKGEAIDVNSLPENPYK